MTISGVGFVGVPPSTNMSIYPGGRIGHGGGASKWAGKGYVKITWGS